MTRAKLVRDYIPTIMGLPEDSDRTRIALPQERLRLLLDKLDEECQEVRDDPSLEEIADVLEVLMALTEEIGGTWNSVEILRRSKRSKRGGFRNAIVLSYPDNERGA